MSVDLNWNNNQSNAALQMIISFEAMKLVFKVVLVLTFLFTSVKVPLTSWSSNDSDTNNNSGGHIRLQCGDFSPPLAILMIIFVHPYPYLFWYTFPVALFLSLFPELLSSLLWRRWVWLRAFLSAIPTCSINLGTVILVQDEEAGDQP